MNLELVQMAVRDGDTVTNLQRTLDAIATCAADTDIVVFPEAVLTGFLERHNRADLAEPLDGPSVQAVLAAVRARNVGVVVGLIERDRGQYFNTSLLITPEGIALAYRKTHLWVGEPDLVQPGDRYSTAEWRGVRLGLLICYDVEFPESARALAELGAELILISDGNMEPYGPVHRTAITARAQENQLFAVMANRVGSAEDSTVYVGGSLAVDPFGQRICEAGTDACRQRFSIDLKQIGDARARYDYRAEKRLALPGERRTRADGRRELLIP